MRYEAYEEAGEFYKWGQCRYLKFAEELLRLSLLAIAVVGFLYGGDTVLAVKTAGAPARILVGLGVILLAVSAASAIGYRYFVTDAYRYFIRGLRLYDNPSLTPKESIKHNGSVEHYRSILQLKCRKTALTRTWRFKVGSAICLVLGALSIGLAFVYILLS